MLYHWKNMDGESRLHRAVYKRFGINSITNGDFPPAVLSCIVRAGRSRDRDIWRTLILQGIGLFVSDSPEDGRAGEGLPKANEIEPSPPLGREKGNGLSEEQEVFPMRLWKKGICLLLAVAAMATVTACGSSSSQSEEPVSSSEVSSSEAAGEASSSESAGEGGTLVVYFSATGNTQAVAQTIADSLNADLYEIVPEDPYTEEDLDWNVADSRVNVEHEDPDFRPAIAGGVPDLSGYDTVFIGYPLWWRQAPNIVWNFVESSDLAGKTMIPFCTSMSDGIGTSGETLAAMAPDATWLAGERFGESLDEASVIQWVESLGLSTAQ